MRKRTYTLLFLFMFSSIHASEKWGRIEGRIVDKMNGEPLPGVNAMLVGTTQGAATDQSGFFYFFHSAGSV